MTVKEILDKENGKYITCYKQGAFWVCYEQSAYLVCLLRGYKPVKKFVKNCKQEVVTIGFPANALEQWIDDTSIETIERSEKTVSLLWKLDFNSHDFIKWKDAIENSMIKKDSKELSLEKQILNFSLANSTPIEAFLFLQKLQLELYKNNAHGTI